MPRQLGLNVEIRPPLPPKDEKIANMEWLVRLHHEDMFLTAQHRYRLQDLGLKFAPPNIATQFSSEVPFINQMRNVPLERVFGAHWMGKVVLTGCNRVRFAQLNEDRLETYSRFLEIWVMNGNKLRPSESSDGLLLMAVSVDDGGHDVQPRVWCRQVRSALRKLCLVDIRFYRCSRSRLPL